jgi:dTDP-4-amino-4,6-dideoxygalactose transaminase
MELNRSHGITRNEFEMTNVSDGPWYYQQLTLGYNYRMTDIQAALGLSQLQKLDKFIETRQNIANKYQQLLSDLPVFTPTIDKESSSSFHLYVIGLNLKEIKKGHRQFFSEMRGLGVGVNLHYIPIYHHPFYESLGFKRGYCQNAEIYYSRSMSLPIYYDLTEKDQMVVVDALRQVIE